MIGWKDFLLLHIYPTTIPMLVDSLLAKTKNIFSHSAAVIIAPVLVSEAF